MCNSFQYQVFSFIRVLLACTVIVIGSNSLFAQSRQQLERNKEDIQKQIQAASQQLHETTQQKSSTVEKLQLISRTISLREKLINNLNYELIKVEEELVIAQQKLDTLEVETRKLKDEYAVLINYAYRNRDKTQRFMFLFSSQSFNQAYIRYRYLNQFTTGLQRKAQIIQNNKVEVQHAIETLNNTRKEKENLLRDKERETRTLQQDQEEQQKLISELQKREKELKREIAQKQQIQKKIEREIRAIIEEETRKAAQKSKTEKPSVETVTLARDFSQNKSKLPWPVDKGFVVSPFGEHAHSALKGIKINNNGIDISASKGAQVRSVFNGVVSKVVFIPGANYTVIIRHGNFLSVYQNLAEVMVKAGDKIRAKQPIGLLFADNSGNSSVLHFEIWQELVKLDPEDWLIK